MPSVNLTRREIATHLNQGFSGTLWDTKLTGFGLRLSASGRGSWLVKKRLGNGGRNAKQILHVFADLAELPDVDQARTQALGVIRDTKAGIDPTELKRRRRIEEHQAYHSGKLSDVFDKFKELNHYDGRYWQEIDRLFRSDVFPSIGADTLISNVTKRDIRDLIERKAKAAPGMARYLFATLRPFFAWCVERELITVSPMADLRPPKPLEARDRVLTDDEVKSVWPATDAMPYPWNAFYKLLLLTAQRRDEVAGIRWTEINGDTWTIPKERTKNGKAHVVHLSPQAQAILASLPKREDTSLIFTFTGTTPISGFAKAKRTLDALLPGDMPAWRAHDLRRTAASGMAKIGVPPHIIERVLNHVSGVNGGLVAVYQRHEYIEERKRAIAVWNDYVTTIVTHRAFPAISELT